MLNIHIMETKEEQLFYRTLGILNLALHSIWYVYLFSHLTEISCFSSLLVDDTKNKVHLFCHTGVEREEELLKGLLTDEYCHVCEAVLLFESQRLSHYEVCAVTEPVIELWYSDIDVVALWWLCLL